MIEKIEFCYRIGTRVEFIETQVDLDRHTVKVYADKGALEIYDYTEEKGKQLVYAITGLISFGSPYNLVKGV